MQTKSFGYTITSDPLPSPHVIARAVRSGWRALEVEASGISVGSADIKHYNRKMDGSKGGSDSNLKSHTALPLADTNPATQIPAA